MRIFLFTVLMGIVFSSLAQFDPAGGEVGSKAVHCESPTIKSWVNKVQINRGWMNIADTSLGRASQGFDTDANGKANGECISLGDGGWAIIELDDFLKDGVGYEFAVFENGFKSNGGYFLEFAHVEVSSDGVHFIRFPSETLLDTLNQFTNASVIDPTKVNNLAGKHPVFWGTPFDLADLPVSEFLNSDSIKFIKIVDAVGSLDTSKGSRDGKGRIINDPWPTPWASSGFDLDAVALLSPGYTGIEDVLNLNSAVYPNPSCPESLITIDLEGITEIELYDSQGKKLSSKLAASCINVPAKSGVYTLRITSQKGISYHKICVR